MENINHPPSKPFVLEPDAAVPSIPELTHISCDPPKQLLLFEEGIEVQQSKAYGVGIDCHSKFIQVSVIVKRDLRTYEYRREYNTDWNSLTDAHSWIIAIISSFSSPPVDMSKPLHYCIESTSTYHIPVIMAFEGKPAIVNPQIAGANKRKTDVLDAKMLAFHDLTGVWPESFLPSAEVKTLRVLINERNHYKHLATVSSNRINNAILRFGYTIGRDGSVTRNKIVRAIIEDEISDSPSGSWSNLCPIGIPEEVRPAIRDEYALYDHLQSQERFYQQQAIEKASTMSWETDKGPVEGITLIDILTTAPGIGTMTAVIWLSNIVTPLRFPNSKAIAAYCGLDPSLKISAGKVTSTVKRGGHRDLHGALCMCASVLIKNHNELFGQWGFNLYKQTGRWKKATNAVARKLAVALYHMNMKAEPFSYDKYNLIRDTVVIDISLDDLVAINHDFKRYVRILRNNGIQTTAQMVDQYYECRLKDYAGLGKRFYGLIKDFITNQKQYREQYYQYAENQEG